jgi:hypothetical protein
MVIGPGLWFLHLVFLYAGHTWLCLDSARVTGFPGENGVQAIVATVTLLLLIALVLLTRRIVMHQHAASRPPFYRPTVLLLLFLSACAVVWQSAAVFAIPLCA